MEIKETVFQIITGDEIISEGSLEGGKVWERYNEELNNGELMPIEPPHIHITTVEDIPYFLFQWTIISFLVYLLILLVYYIFSRFRKIKSPLKYAFKRSRWWIIIFIFIPIIFIGIFSLNNSIFSG